MLQEISLGKRLISPERWTKFWPLYWVRPEEKGPDRGSNPPKLWGMMGCKGERKIFSNILSYEKIKRWLICGYLFTAFNGWINMDNVFSIRSHHARE